MSLWTKFCIVTTFVWSIAIVALIAQLNCFSTREIYVNLSKDYYPNIKGKILMCQKTGCKVIIEQDV